MIFLSKKMQLLPEHEATPTRNGIKKCQKNEHVTRLLRLCGFETLFPQESSESKAEERQLQNLQKSRGPTRRCEGFDSSQGWEKIRKNTRNVDLNTRNDTFTPENKKPFFRPKTFFCNKNYFTPETRVHQKQKSLYSRHISHQAAQTFYTTGSP